MKFLIRNTSQDELKSIFSTQFKSLFQAYRTYLFNPVQKSRWFSFLSPSEPRSADALLTKSDAIQRGGFFKKFVNIFSNKPQTYIALALRKLFTEYPKKNENQMGVWRQQVFHAYHKLIKAILTDNNSQATTPLTFSKVKTLLGVLQHNRTYYQHIDFELNIKHDRMISHIVFQSLQDLAPHEAFQLRKILKKTPLFDDRLNAFLQHQLWLKSQGIIYSEFNISRALPENEVTATVIKACDFIENSTESDGLALPKLSKDQIFDYYATAAKYLLAATQNNEADQKSQKADELFQRYCSQLSELGNKAENFLNLDTNQKLEKLTELIHLTTSTTTFRQELHKFYDCCKLTDSSNELAEQAERHDLLLRKELSKITQHIATIYLSLESDKRAQTQAHHILNQTSGTSLNTLISSKPGNGLDSLFVDVYLDYALKAHPSNLHKYRDVMLYRYHSPNNLGNAQYVPDEVLEQYQLGWKMIAEGYQQGKYGFSVNADLAESYNSLLSNVEETDLEKQSDTILSMSKAYLQLDDIDTAKQLLYWLLQLENEEEPSGNRLEARRLLAKVTTDPTILSKCISPNTLEGIRCASKYYIAVMENYDHVLDKHSNNGNTARLEQRKYILQAQEYLLNAVKNHQKASEVDPQTNQSCQTILEFFRQLNYLPYEYLLVEENWVHNLDDAFNNLLQEDSTTFHDIWLISEGLMVGDQDTLNDEMRALLGVKLLSHEELYDSVTRLEQQKNHAQEQCQTLQFGCRQLAYKSQSGGERIKQALIATGMLCLAGASAYLTIQTSPAIFIAYPLVKIAMLCLSSALATIGIQKFSNALQGHKWSVTFNNAYNKSFKAFLSELGVNAETGRVEKSNLSQFFSEAKDEPEFDAASKVIQPASA